MLSTPQPTPPDVPSPIDLQDEADARQWASRAQAIRPWRATFFDTFAAELARLKPTDPAGLRVLELSSGPGFLAESLLPRLPTMQLVLLDFSAPMHAMARERLQPWIDRVAFEQRSFKAPGWRNGIGLFDAVITHQAVHELRHKRHTAALHREVRAVLQPGGAYWVSDHFVGEGGMQNTELYMTVEEQVQALREAGFTAVDQVLCLQGLAMHRARG